MAGFNWKSFVKIINNNGILPVIGNDLSMVQFPKDEFTGAETTALFETLGTADGNTIRINLYQFVALKLWEDHGNGKIPSPPTLNNVVLELHKQNVGENEINREIKSYVSGLTDEQIVLEPFRKLCRIPGFDTFLTVNPDNFLERAFGAEDTKFNESMNYSIPLPSMDQDKEQDKALVSIYNLMGNINGFNFAITEEQSLEYLYKLQKGHDKIVSDLFDSIKDKAILLLGCSFPNWFMRFFIRIISKERFKNGIKTKYVACDRTLQDIELSYFLEYNSAKVIRIGADADQDPNEEKVYKDSLEFIDEMYEEWQKNSERSRNETRFKEVVFLSYSWDDKTVVERLKNEFEKNGVRVFFDDDKLKTGDRYNQVIKKYIKDCDYFVPIISKNAIGNQDRYVYDKEWKSAIVLDGYKDQSYIRPYIIDDTPPTDDRIPEEIRNINIENIQEVDEFGNTVRKFIKENKLTAIDL